MHNKKYDNFSGKSEEKREEKRMEIYINVKNFGKIKEAQSEYRQFHSVCGK